jgi:hypothetical protein
MAAARRVVSGVFDRSGIAAHRIGSVDVVIVRAYSRADNDVGLAGLLWPNVGAGDVLEFDYGRVIHVVDVVARRPARRSTRS